MVNPRYRPPIAYEQATWTLKWGDIECGEYLRFTGCEIAELAECFQLNGHEFKTIMTDVGYPTTGERALCVTFYRLAYPMQLKYMMQIFHCSRSAISITVNHVVTYLYTKYHKLEWDFQLPQIKEYEATIAQACPGIHGIWGFIDGTVRPIARPLVDQEGYYSGHKWYHGVKYQGIVTPDGLISSLYGPDFGPVGDWKLWKECQIE